MLAAGMLGTAFVPSALAWLIYATYGIVGGFGVGAGYNAIISAAQKWFPDNRGLATGITVCAFGFSTVVFAPLIEGLIGALGVRNTFLALSAAFFVVVLSLFRMIKLPAESGQPGAPSEALMAKKQYGMGEAVKTKEFYFITLSLMFATAAFFILNPSIKSLAVERGFSSSAATATVMLIGVSNALGRLGTPMLSDKIGRENATIAVALATAACALLLSFAKGFLFVCAVGVIAFCYGGYSGIYPVLTADYFGIKNVGSNYGAVMVGFAISALTFPMAVGLIGNQTLRFAVLAAMAGVAAALVLLLAMAKKKKEA